MHLSFFRTHLKENYVFAEVLKTQLLAVWSFLYVVDLCYHRMVQVGVSVLWYCSTFLFTAKLNSDTSNCGMKLTAAAKSFICLLHSSIRAINTKSKG